MLYGKLMMSWQGMVMGTRSRSESRTRVFPALTTSNDDSGWGEDDEFEEINMSHFKREVYSPHRGSSYGAVYPSTPSSTLSGCTQLQTPASAQRDAPMTRRTHTPSATPLPGAQGVGVVETAATVLDRQARGVGFRKKSPPVRVASGSAGLTPVHQSHGCISRSSSLSSPYSAAANPSLARPRPRPAAPQSVFSSPGVAGKQPKRQVQIEDDDKWDDDW
nr:unnamed protein product [Leishmania braziliensis]